MEIEINDTPVTTDDLVGLKCEHPAHRNIVNCRIRATAVCATSSTVVLTNPDGRLRFPNPADTTTTVTVPGDGSWVSFQISGERGSNAIGDAVIEAHCNTATGALKATKPATVFWFDQAQMNVTPGGNYTLAGGTFAVAAGHAVDYSAQARIRPAGVDCTAPQVTNLRIGIMQNTRPGVRDQTTWGNPTIVWNVGVAPGTTVVAASTMRTTFNRPIAANDSEVNVAPLYDQPGHPGSTIDPNCLNPPIGCAGGAASTSNDNPSTPVANTFTSPAQTPAGVRVGTLTYRLINVTMDPSFVAWAAVFNTVTNEVCTLRERVWAIHVDSAGAGPQRATASPDTAPTADPITGAPFANTIAADPANETTGPGSAATTTFTK